MKMMDDARKNEHVKLLLGERAIEDAILEKLHHRHGAADGGDHRKQSRVLSIDTAIPFQSRGANATLFSHRGRIWILVACFDQDE
jgi:hypothetical protein